MKALHSKTKRTLSATAFFAASILAIIFLNIVIGALADKLPLRIDVTKKKLYALTEETTHVLNALEKEVTLHHFVSPGYEDENIERVLDMYRSACPKLKTMRYDPNSNPIAARRFSDKGVSIQQNTMVIELDSRFKAISPADVYTSYTTGSGSTLENAFFGLEKLLTRAIAYVSTESVKRVLFTIGHGELDYASVLKTLQDENIETYQLDLKTQEIPETADSIYILAPASDFTADEILRLDAFLSKGRGVHICFDARRQPLPRLEKYLQEYWGVTMYHDLVCEGNPARTLNYAYMFLPTVASHIATDDIASGNQSLAFMYTRSLSLSGAEGVEAVPLATTSKDGFSVHGSDPAVRENIREGELPVAAALTKKSMDGSVESRLVVSGSFEMYASSFLDEGALENRSFLYGVTNFVNKEEAGTLSVSPKSLLLEMVVISDALTRFYIFLVCILPPLLCFVLGFISFRRRRHL